VNKKIFSIWSVLLILVVSIAVVVPGCDDGACTGEIEVKATLCDLPWEGDVDYTLTGPGAAAPTIINGTNVTALFDNVDCGNWTCTYDGTGGPPGAYLVDITPPSPQDVTSGSTKTFTLNFELEQDAWIECLGWTIDGVPIEEYQYAEFFEGDWYAEVFPCQIIDAHFVQGVYGCEGRVVSVNETSWLHITDLNPPGVGIYVVNEDCAVNKTALEGPTPKKVSQTTTIDGVPVGPGGEPIPLLPQMSLDVETIWELEKEIDYEKSINWLGISVFPFEPPVVPHPCVLFELLLPGPGGYFFQLIAEAEVELMDDEDVNTQNNNAICLAPLILTVIVP